MTALFCRGESRIDVSWKKTSEGIKLKAEVKGEFYGKAFLGSNTCDLKPGINIFVFQIK